VRAIWKGRESRRLSGMVANLLYTSNWHLRCWAICHVLTCHCELQEPGNDMDDEGGSVKIFVQFEDAEMAQRAQQALNGRWFGGRMVCFSSRYRKELKHFSRVSIYPESAYTPHSEC
jgi:hypothetical protein